MPKTTAPPPPYFAAIDLGSNSFHLLIVKINDGVLETVDRVKEMVQIAKGVKSNHVLSEEAQETALHCLSCFHERIRDIPPAQVRVVGTKALRMAKNADTFLKQAEKALKHSIEIVSGYEEARLVYLGVSRDISADKGQRLVIDIGGGSTEFIIGSGEEPKLLESLSIGCVTYSDQFFSHSDDKISTKALEKMFDEAYYATCIELETIERSYRKVGWDIAIGSSGTMRAIAELMPQELVNGVITQGELLALKEKIIQSEGKLSFANGISSQRRGVLPAGVAILLAIFDQLKLETIHVVSSSLKEGLIYDVLGRLSTRDMREKTVKKLMRQYQADEPQANRVNKALNHFVKPLLKQLNLNGIDLQKIIHWAALLHEIGTSISHSKYHHHSAYLLTYSDMAGFTRFEQELLALLVGAHRRKISPERLALLKAEGQQSLAKCLVCLRLSVLLNHRREDGIELPEIHFDDMQIKLNFSEDWLDKHPLTYRNLLREQRYLSPLDIEMVFF